MGRPLSDDQTPRSTASMTYALSFRLCAVQLVSPFQAISAHTPTQSIMKSKTQPMAVASTLALRRVVWRIFMRGSEGRSGSHFNVAATQQRPYTLPSTAHRTVRYLLITPVCKDKA